MKNIATRLFTKLTKEFSKLAIGAKCYCGVCSNRVQRFMPYRGGTSDISTFIVEMDLIGSDVENFSCPICASHDRERHLMMYLKASGIIEKMNNKKILHIAPEEHIAKIIEQLTGKYIQADLHPKAANLQKVNIEKTQFPDSHFDFVIANHVLEHVESDAKALKEIHRILNPGGYAVLQTPYSYVLHHTFYDPGIKTASARLIAYGQEDHQRLYGRNLPAWIESFGFNSLMESHENLLYGTDSKKLGVNPREPFFLFQKPLAEISNAST